jgi:hypothetical protein
LASSQRVDINLFKSAGLSFSAFASNSVVDENFYSMGLPRKPYPFVSRSKNSHEFSVGGEFNLDIAKLTLTHTMGKPFENGQEKSKREDASKALLWLSTSPIKSVLNSVGGGRFQGLLPDSFWFSYEPGQVAFEESAHDLPDKTQNVGIGSMWNWSNTYASMSYWRYIYDGRQIGAEDADWVGNGIDATFGMYGTNWNLDISLNTGVGSNREVDTRSDDRGNEASLAFSYYPDQWPGVDVTWSTGDYRTDYVAYQGRSSFDYQMLEVELDLSKYVNFPLWSYEPKFSTFYTFKKTKYHDSFLNNEDNDNHIIGLYYYHKF